MKKNKQLFINLFTTLFVLIINIVINFGLSRYIVDVIGESAYGFVSLANTFVSYATIFTTALNSMASRFITIDIFNYCFIFSSINNLAFSRSSNRIYNLWYINVCFNNICFKN